MRKWEIDKSQGPDHSTIVGGMISIENLSKRFGQIRALSGVSLTVEKGEFFGLVGPNGAGKSTLMHILSGYLFPDQGKLELAGKTLKDTDKEGRRILGLVPQSIALYDKFSAMVNLEVFGSTYGIPPKELKEKIKFWLDKMQLWDRRKDKVKAFSGGMKRRLNLAASLLHDPEILLCDEPTVGVDPQSRNAIFDFLEEQNENGLTVVYSTHYMEEVERLCKRIAIIDAGKIIAMGSRNDLVAQLPYNTSIQFDIAKVDQALREQFLQFGTIEEDGKQGTLHPEKGFKLSEFFAVLESGNIPYNRFRIKQPSLEGLFLHLTGKQMRE